jgi:hypothetical protein
MSRGLDDAAGEPAISPQDATGSGPLRFVGTNGDWFDAQNWEGGSVPGAGDDVLIDGDAFVAIDPSQNPDPTGNPGTVVVHDILLRDDAVFETLPGTSLEFNDFDAGGESTFFAYSSEWQGNSLSGGGTDCPKWQCGYNPSVVDVQSYDVNGTDLTFYLGGTEPAAPGATGPGHYAAVRSSVVSLTDSELAVGFKYGFTPNAGDRFVLVEATQRLTGTFANYAQGDEVAQAGTVKLVISYETDRIVLDAEPL